MGRAPASGSKCVRDIAPPIQLKFCRSAQEFHNERGLSLTGVDPRSFWRKKDICARNWKDVFSCPMPGLGQGLGYKVKSYHVKPEFVEPLIHRHWDVYQQEPNNYEIGLSFAKAFALENCRAAREASDEDKLANYTIAWAEFAQKAMETAAANRNMSAKRKRWEEAQNLNSVSLRTDGNTSSMNVGIASMKPLYDKAKLESIQRMCVLADGRCLAAKNAVEQAQLRVDDACRDLHRAEGILGNRSVVDLLQVQIRKLESEEERARLLKILKELQPDINGLRNNVDDMRMMWEMLTSLWIFWSIALRLR